MEKSWFLIQSKGGGYLILGYINSYGAGGYDFYPVKSDNAGNELWSKTYGCPGDDFESAVRVGQDGGYIIVGTNDSFGAVDND